MAEEQAGEQAGALIVAGPTASGKSALALSIAAAVRGTIINADAMQVYRELRLLTARPTPADEALVPHALYGTRPAACAGSVAWWRGAALAAMAAARAAGRLPILCGGSGMYLTALTGGLADIPDPGAAARAEARALLAALGPDGLHRRLAEADPATAARLRPSDPQRLARAWEVWAGTGRGLADWQAAGAGPAEGWRFRAVLLDPPRPTLRTAIAARFAHMLAAGAVEEVRALLASRLDPALPAMRAHGVPELAAHLRGEIGLDEAEARAVGATRRYTRRQATWFRHHRLATERDTRTINARIGGGEQFSDQDMADLLNFVRGSG
ncbi:MAG TPA: tRNA (adenosine(37)-N6)-dimethylallyltransferase MiaA [Acetobacteraceae bacterium]|nr:tRNA (adenosine(37)-N6)-dimethylallyltransferase MiaA [Acetobacteraceae bacterium]